jgi:hypothetical protein
VCFGERPQPALDTCIAAPPLDAMTTREHALRVAVEYRMPLPAGEREDRAGGRAADARQ